MKFITFKSGDTTRLGVLDNNDVIDIAKVIPSVPSDLRAALEQGIDLIGAAQKAVANVEAERIPLDAVGLASLVPNAGKVVCLGHNYFDHAKEGGNLKPVYPLIFSAVRRP